MVGRELLEHYLINHFILALLLHLRADLHTNAFDNHFWPLFLRFHPNWYTPSPYRFPWDLDHASLMPCLILSCSYLKMYSILWHKFLYINKNANVFLQRMPPILSDRTYSGRTGSDIHRLEPASSTCHEQLFMSIRQTRHHVFHSSTLWYADTDISTNWTAQCTCTINNSRHKCP